jgi:hypothetical protein
MLEQCAQMKACAPNVYAQSWNNDDALCQSEAVRLCTALPSAYDDTVPGVADPVACKTAISGTCASYLAAMDQPPAACRPAYGTKTLDQGCLVTAQCGAGLRCFGSGPATCSEYCGPVGKAGRPCAPSGTPEDDLCDPANGLHCVFGVSGSSLDQTYLCHMVTYGALDAPCFSAASFSSEEQCGSGLACQYAGVNTPGGCVALLQQGATCSTGATDKDPCDGRLGLSCLPTDLAHPTNGSTCQPAYVVPDTATCGMVMDGSVLHNHVCGDYSFCNSSSVCQHKAMSGQPCETGGCYPTYECTVGTCQAPMLQADPPCAPVTTVPQNQLACGVTPGQLPLVCGSACCLPSGYTNGSPTCAAVGMCGTEATVWNELDCEDSSQCAAGKVCCLSFNPTNTALPPVKATCTATASCGVDLQICRTDGTALCGGAGCTPAPTSPADWTVFLPPDVGFCKAPTCVPPNDGEGCGGNSMCCSNDCDLGSSSHGNLCF